MSLETTSKNTFSYVFNIVYLTFLKSILNAIDAKDLAKENITKSLTLFNYFCFWLSIFPFLCFIGKFSSSDNLGIISLNLPGLTKSSNELFWETLLTPFDYTQNIFNNVKNINIDANSLSLNHKKINPSIQTLIEYYQPTNGFDNRKSDLLLKEFKPRETLKSVKSQIFYDLDDIPYKLESTIQNFSEQKESYKTDLNHSALLINQKQSDQKSKNFKVSLNKEKTKLKIIKTQEYKQFNNPNIFKNSSSFVFSDFKNFVIANDLFLKHFKNEILKAYLNQNAASISHESQLLYPRSMTWYQYPDMNEKQIWQYKLNEFYGKNSNNYVISSSYYPKSIYFNDFSTPALQNSITGPYYETYQSNNDESANLFIKHDSTTLDIKLKNKGVFTQSFFDNAIQNNIENNKGVYFFANLTKEDFQNLLNVETTKQVINEKQTQHLNQSIIFNGSFFALYDPSVSRAQLKEFYDSKLSEVVNDKNTNLIQISDLRTGQVFLLNSNSIIKNPKNILKTFENFQTENSRYELLNFSNQLIKFNQGFVEYSPNLYKREIGSYWKNKLNLVETDEFLTINEPVTINSIFSFSLLGFLISTFLILKTAYADYAKEFSSYLLDLISSGKGLPLDQSTIEWLNQELGIEEKKGGIRVFPKRFSKKRFTDIAGIKFLLPELSELVWFLRNKGRAFSVTGLASKSVLLVGPPGTGKTLLVQALAAEAEVPVVAQSTSVLSGMSQDLTPGDAIRMAFQKARSLAPCILFLDELDSLGLKRDSLLLNQSEQNLGFTQSVSEKQNSNFFEKTQSTELEITDSADSVFESKSDYLTNQLRINITNDFNQKKQQERDQVAALTQLLIEIDGLQSNNGVLVIGATNRPNVLDPALTRPGRFSKIISLPLPDKPKRIEILKLYSKNLGWEQEINWNYLAQRTKGFSAGDLSAIANQSSIQAILTDSKHNLESFEKAITTLTTYPRENVNRQLLTKNDPYYLKREVYYKVGKTIYNYLFEVDGKNSFVELVSRDPNPRQFQIFANLNQDKNKLRIRKELENILTSLLAGKASELLMLLTTENKDNLYWESDFCKNDFYEATRLVITMIQDWYLYDNQYSQQKFLNIPTNQNDLEYAKNEEVYELLKETTKYLEQQLVTDFKIPNSESLSQKAHWKADILQEISNIDGLFAEWSRFHLPDPQETDRNPEWIPPEEYYHENETKRFSLEEKSNLYKILQSELFFIEREKQAQTLLISSFNKALLFLELNRELLDTLCCFLVKRKILRDFEIEKLIY